MKKFEIMYFMYEDDWAHYERENPDIELEKLGNDGWELVSVLPPNNKGGCERLWLKREIV